jgi:hypothetical protein
MTSSRTDWAKLVAGEARISPILKVDELAHRLNTSELLVRKALLRQEHRGLVEHFGKKLFINRLSPDFTGRELVNVLRPESYVSLETVLRDSGVSSQAPIPITCVTTTTGWSFRGKNIAILFRHIAPTLYWGFHRRRTKYGDYLVAEPEKALLDWLYLSRKTDQHVSLDELNLKVLDAKKLMSYSHKYPRTLRHELAEMLVGVTDRT